MLANAAAQSVTVATRAATRVGAKRRCVAAKASRKPLARRVSTRSSAPLRAAPVTRASSITARPSPPASEVSLGGKLRAVCQVFFPPRVTPRQALKERLSCVLTLDRASLLPEEESTLEHRVRGVMEEYVELQHGVSSEDLYAPKLETRVDGSGCQVYELKYRVKRARVAHEEDAAV